MAAKRIHFLYKSFGVYSGGQFQNALAILDLLGNAVE